jgi:hypothetical protein
MFTSGGLRLEPGRGDAHREQRWAFSLSLAWRLELTLAGAFSRSL